MAPEVQPKRQPRLLQRINPFKPRKEGVLPLGQPKPVTEPLQRTQIKEITPSWEKNPLLTAEARERLKAYDEQLERAGEEVQRRVDNAPKGKSYVEIEGKRYTFVEAYRVIAAKMDRQEAEARARGEPDPMRIAPFVSPQLVHNDSLTPEQRRARTRFFMYEVDNHLIREVEDAQFDQLAAEIKNSTWKNPRASVHLSGQIAAAIKDNGIIRNHSRHGVTLSYTHDDIGKPEGKDKIVTIPQREELSFGIGYFDQTHIIPEAREMFTENELERGIKAYYVERSYTVEERGKAVRKTELVAIPLIYAAAQQKFIEHLYKGAKITSPETVIPQAQQRIQTHRRSQRAAA